MKHEVELCYCCIHVHTPMQVDRIHCVMCHTYNHHIMVILVQLRCLDMSMNTTWNKTNYQYVGACVQLQHDA
jgi:hypothetical protein